MKTGLLEIPRTADFQKAYASLLHSNPSDTSAQSLVLFSQWCRFDSRLSEIWVKYIHSHWKTILPTELNDLLLPQPWAAAAGVLLEFVQLSFSKDVVNDLKKFILWKEIVTHKVSPAPWEIFFIGLQPLGSKSMFEDACYSLTEYSAWGYLGREVLINKASSSSVNKPHLRKEVRYQILKGLLEGSPRVHTKTYWEAIDRSISIRQAERDLETCAFLKSGGNTKGRYYLLRR